MLAHRRKLFIRGFLFTLVLLFPVFGVAPYDNPFQNLGEEDRKLKDEGMALFVRAAQGVWSGQVQLERAMSLLAQVETGFKAIQDDPSRSYLLAQIELTRGRAVVFLSPKMRSKEKTRALAHFDEAITLAHQSLDLYESADGYRILADAGASWMALKGLFGIIKMAPNVKEWSDKAIAINPDNFLSIIINASGQIHAPKISGGDPQKAVKRLSALVSRLDLSVIGRFRAFLNLSQAHRKLKNEEVAIYFCDEAQKIFSDNPLLQQCRG